MSIPNDPVILLSFVNMKLRDFYPSLEELCRSLQIEEASLVQKLSDIGYRYNKQENRFL